MKRVNTLKMSEKNMNWCEACNKTYLQPSLLDQHLEREHSQRQTTTDSTTSTTRGPTNVGTAHEYSWFIECTHFPHYMSEHVRILLQESRRLHKDQCDVLRAMLMLLLNDTSEYMTTDLVDQLFSNGQYSWRKIIQMFTIGMDMLEISRLNNDKQLYYNTIEMFIYTLNRADSWIQNEGGWATFVNIYN